VPSILAQTIRLIFDEPQSLRRIALVFEETEIERTQDFVLRWSGDCGGSFQEIVRQQWNFSPLTPCARSRNIKLTCPGSTFWNWSLYPTSEEDWLAPRSRVCERLNSAARRVADPPILSAQIATTMIWFRAAVKPQDQGVRHERYLKYRQTCAVWNSRTIRSKPNALRFTPDEISSCSIGFAT